MIEYKEPTEEQIEDIKAAQAAMAEVLKIFLKYDGSRQCVNAYEKAEEAMMWFNTAVLNFNGNNDENDASTH